MNALIYPCELSGTIQAIPSKSEAHRALICAALSDEPTRIICSETSDDIEATIGCLEALGARIERGDGSIVVTPIARPIQSGALLDCHESGSTLRFLLPVAIALGGASFKGAGRLGTRPLKPLVDALRSHGADIDSDGELPLDAAGHLNGGVFTLPGNISSQFITGILLAAPLLSDPVEIRVSEPIESKPYIALTLQMLSRFHVDTDIIHEDDRTCYRIHPEARYTSPQTLEIGGDWSNSAFWLAAGALSGTGIGVNGLELSSKQADRAAMGALTLFGAHVARSKRSAAARNTELHGATIDVASCPDLVPAIAPVAALATGRSIICKAGRLRLKESDRLRSISSALNGIGAHVWVDGDSLIFEGVERFTGGEVDAANDHRIAMMAAIASVRSSGPIIIRGADCVAKSYPRFFDDFESLGGNVIWEV